MAGIDAFALLVEEMKSDDVVEQVEAAKRINTIALGMGAEKAKAQLLPFLRTCVDEYTDEILLAIAEVAGTMVKALGGGEFAHNLVPILEALAEKDETIVRTKAVESLVIIGKEMPANQIQAEVLPLLKRLSSADFFPSRISAAGLFATVYPSTPAPMRPAIRKQYETLAKDEMPMVRSAAFAHMPALAAVVEKEVYSAEISPLFNELSADLQESVRELAVQNMVDMVKTLSPDEAAKYFGTFFDNCQNEKCSAMRVTKAKHFVTLASAMNPARPVKDQVPAFLQLLAGDLEMEVRNAAAGNIADFCSKLDGQTVLGQILPVLRDLSKPQDEAAMGGAMSNQQVRECIAEQICSLAPVLGREGSINELLPLVKLFLADEIIELKRKVLGAVAPLVETLGADAADAHLLPEVLKMSADTQWRVRFSVVETIPVYAQHLGMDLFHSRLKDVQARALSDSVAQIREQAIKNLNDLTTKFGESWTREQMLPGIQEAAKGTGPASYLGRITALQAVGQLASSISASVLANELVALVVVPLARDRVTNVRIAASDALYRCMGKLKAENSGMVKETIQPILAELSQDPDPDVKYFAELAMRM
mmetsp:Transcript_34754/g.54295  ORF Transcript_34754/g.54295 Transcript_34754/m.54295 type:complete len:595 (+) Transcript_34754:104-1888(+)|eukprot:CAMPEP_0184289336 /NCGR_PEP_ID=MMETSP1049-20130417/1791_1 /TAXON_ID=77928 /ORGANISM="Proteomonas sulcata, Strain CCMP704" /LENGTH=594 /DNA_ID=CAMNT_0026596087 /DNA_START=48 /DNA_END=1832 /DNA_ORIENTATION=-